MNTNPTRDQERAADRTGVNERIDSRTTSQPNADPSAKSGGFSFGRAGTQNADQIPRINISSAEQRLDNETFKLDRIMNAYRESLCNYNNIRRSSHSNVYKAYKMSLDDFMVGKYLCALHYTKNGPNPSADLSEYCRVIFQGDKNSRYMDLSNAGVHFRISEILANETNPNQRYMFIERNGQIRYFLVN